MTYLRRVSLNESCGLHGKVDIYSHFIDGEYVMVREIEKGSFNILH